MKQSTVFMFMLSYLVTYAVQATQAITQQNIQSEDVIIQQILEYIENHNDPYSIALKQYSYCAEHKPTPEELKLGSEYQKQGNIEAALEIEQRKVLCNTTEYNWQLNGCSLVFAFTEEIAKKLHYTANEIIKAQLMMFKYLTKLDMKRLSLLPK